MKTYEDGLNFAIKITKGLVQKKDPFNVHVGVNSNVDHTLMFLVKELERELENGRTEEGSG
jgi:hypothetical protein